MADYSVDFSPIANLPNVYRDARTRANRERTLATLAQGASLEDVSRALIASGDPQGLALAQLAMQYKIHSPEYAAQMEEARLKVGEKYKPTTANIKLPGGDEVTVQKGPRGYELPTVQGLQPNAGPDTAPIPPGVNAAEYRKKLAAEQADIWAKKPQAESSVNDAVANLDRLKAEAQAIYSSSSVPRITGMTGMFPSLPGGNAADLEAKLETLKSQTGFSVLQNMRDASKTGGALGAISDKENIMLQNNLAALSQKQSPEQFRKSLQQIIEYTDQAKSRIKSGFDRTYAPFQQQPQQQGAQRPMSKADYDALPSGSPYTAPDGSARTKR